MMKTHSPTGSISISIPSNDAEVNNNEEENGKQVLAKFLGDGAKPQIESYSSCKRVSLALTTVAFLASFIVFLYVIVMFATHQKHEKKIIIANETLAIYPKVCLNCERLVQNSYTHSGSDKVFEGLIVQKEDNVMKCCAESQGQMSAMLKLVARRQDSIKSVKSSSVVVHKQMKSESMDALKGYRVVEFDLNNNETLSEQCQGATNIGHGIVITNSGTYYVYSNALFNGTGAEKSSLKHTWSSHIYRESRQSNTRTGVLLTAVHTLCRGCTQDKLTSFTAGVFQLQSGDLIQVFLSDKGAVQFNKVSSYLGMVMLNAQ